MCMRILLILGLFVIFLVAMPAYTYPALTGPTGLVNLPSAEVVPVGQCNVAADFAQTENNVREMKNSYPVRLQGGVWENLEVGACININGAGDQHLWNANGKYATPFGIAGLDLAIGALYQSADTNPFLRITQVYVAGTRDLGCARRRFALKGTLGANWTQVEIGGKITVLRAYAGFDVDLNRKIALVGEYQSKDAKLDEESLWGTAVRYPLTHTLTGEVGYTNGPISGAKKANVFLGVNYAYGTGK